MTAGQQRDKCLVDDAMLSEDDAPETLARRRHAVAKVLNFGRQPGC